VTLITNAVPVHRNVDSRWKRAIACVGQGLLYPSIALAGGGRDAASPTMHRVHSLHAARNEQAQNANQVSAL
jgi:hypothetical protein